ncbi:MAG: tail fiber domain-containing protein [Saprospiraceae bacterium]|nr:tail fiber domain-containing protein [Candidatus Opimibacter skivensis]
MVKQIRPVQFSYNGQAGIPDDTSTFVGIIAQELKPVAPYMIGEFTYTSPDGQKENYMDYDGTAMTYILINAVKEQQAIIDQLKAKHQNELDALKDRIEYHEHKTGCRCTTGEYITGKLIRLNGLAVANNISIKQ